MSVNIVTYAVIDKALDNILEADPDEWDDRKDAEAQAAELKEECGGSFHIVKITRQILKAKKAKKAKRS